MVAYHLNERDIFTLNKFSHEDEFRDSAGIYFRNSVSPPN